MAQQPQEASPPEASPPEASPPEASPPEASPPETCPPEASPPARRPYVLLSCAMSLDGYIDDASEQRLELSGDADWDQVDQLRASCDAILVGAGTIRADNPRLLLRSADRRAERVAQGAPANPTKVTVTGSGHLDPAARFFTAGPAARIVYAAAPAASGLRARLGDAATVVSAGDPVDLARILADLAGRGITRLMVEGGGCMHTQFLALGLADELRLAIAPLFVGDSRAPRFVADGQFPWNPARRARLVEVGQAGEVAVLRYALSDRYDPR